MNYIYMYFIYTHINIHISNVNSTILSLLGYIRCVSSLLIGFSPNYFYKLSNILIYISNVYIYLCM